VHTTRRIEMDVWIVMPAYNEERTIGGVLDSGFEILKIEREHVVPAQVSEISGALENLFNRHHLIIDKLDTFLNATLLNFFSQALIVISKKVGR